MGNQIPFGPRMKSLGRFHALVSADIFIEEDSMNLGGNMLPQVFFGGALWCLMADGERSHSSETVSPSLTSLPPW